MADDKPSPVVSLVSLIPQCRAEGMAAEIEALMHRAGSEGRGRVAYLLECALRAYQLECALIEARYQADKRHQVRMNRDADRRDLWRPRDL